jgi:hypothetical protein
MKYTILATAMSLMFATSAYAADPHLGRTAFSLENAHNSQETFKSDTAKIVLHAEILDSKKGTQVGGQWIAVDTNGATPPNYKIDSASSTMDVGATEAALSLGKPNTDWPTGKYRVDLSIDGKLAGSTSFMIVGSGSDSQNNTVTPSTDDDSNKSSDE